MMLNYYDYMLSLNCDDINNIEVTIEVFEFDQTYVGVLPNTLSRHGLHVRNASKLLADRLSMNDNLSIEVFPKERLLQIVFHDVTFMRYEYQADVVIRLQEEKKKANDVCDDVLPPYDETQRLREKIRLLEMRIEELTAMKVDEE